MNPIAVTPLRGDEEWETLVAHYPHLRTTPELVLSDRDRTRAIAADLRDFVAAHPDSTWVARDERGLCGLLGAALAPWESRHFGIRAANIEHLLTVIGDPQRQRTTVDALLLAYRQWHRAQGLDFVAAKLPSADLVAIGALEDEGFRYVESLTFLFRDCRRGRMLPPRRTVYVYRQIQPTDVQVVVPYARASFSFARFMADTRFPRDQAVDFYERWMRNMCHDLPDTAYVMEIDGRTVGFYISRVDDLTERMGLRVGRMILAAIDPTLRGQGIGFDLTRNTVAWLLEKADIIEGAVITRNAPMFNLLTELGFQVRVPRVTLHHWTEKTHE